MRNTGAAFGIGANAQSQIVPLLLNFGAIGVFGIVVVYALRSAVTDRLLQTGLHLILGGAIGNLIDRVSSKSGVIDFIDVGISEITRWPTFNVADMAVSFGAFLLAWVLWEEDRDLAGDVAPVRAASVARESGEI